MHAPDFLQQLPWNALVSSCVLACGFAQVNAFAQVNVLTNRYNQSRTAANTNETQLTPANVNTSTFGSLGTYSVDGIIFAQPLYAQSLTINGATHNVLFVGTMHDVMYAFDADTVGSAPLWKLDFRNAAAGIQPAPIHIGQTPSSDSTVGDTMGIFGTPVIDLPNNRTFFVTHTLENGTEYFRLRNVNILTGALTASTLITASVPASGSYAAQTFISSKYCQRPALELVNGQVWLAFGSRPPGDYTDPYEGWVMTYSATSLAQTGVFVTSRTNGNSIWQSGSGPAVDANGNVYYLTANGGTYTPGLDLPESLIQLSYGNGITLNNWYTPDSMANSDNNSENYVYMDQLDLDLGVTGPIMIPGTKLITFGSKTSILFLLNTTNLGQLTANDTQVLQHIQVGATPNPVNNDGDRIVGMAYWPQASGGTLFVWPGEDALHAYTLNTSTSTYTQTYAGSFLLNGEPSTVLSVSANGSTHGIVWAPVVSPGLQTRAVGTPGTLHAYSAANPATELWNSGQVASDSMGTLAKFVIPVVANGKVYIANSGTAQSTTAGSVTVYGLKIGTTPQTINFPPIAAQNPGVSLTLNATASSGLPVTNYVSSTQSICTTSGSTLTLLVAGTCTVTAYQAGNITYAAATPVTQSFTVNLISPPTGTPVCSGDSGTCVIPSGAKANVYYGAGSSYHLLQGITGSVSCSAGAFNGDPDPGVGKSCYALITALPAISPVCAPDGGTCTVSPGSSATVYYGASSSYFFLQGVSGALGCGVTAFGGDPDAGVTKSCYAAVNSSGSGHVLINSVPGGAVLCASENGTCTLPAGATATVYFGSTGNYFSQSGVTGSLSCSNTTFTDPDIGIVKSCYALVNALPSNAVACAGEGGTCPLQSNTTSAVYYGANGGYSYQPAVTGSVSCGVSSFSGDPDSGVAKACYAVPTAVPAGLLLRSTAVPATAVQCSSENGTCTIPAGETASVFFGAGTSYIFKQGVTGSLVCSNTVFGADPDYGIGKACYAYPTLTQVTPAFNINGIFRNGVSPTNGGFDADGYAYSSSLRSNTLAWSGIPFTLGTAGTLDAVSSTTVTLPAGNFPTLYLLAAAVNGQQLNQTFTVTYTDGTTSSFVQSLSDWGIPAKFSGESTAVSMAYRVVPGGSTQNGPWYIYGYLLPLNPNKTVKSLTLPNNRNVVVLAISL